MMEMMVVVMELSCVLNWVMVGVRGVHYSEVSRVICCLSACLPACLACPTSPPQSRVVVMGNDADFFS